MTGLEPRASFATTRWGLVHAAGRSDPAARVALEELCARYWYPLYAYLRRGGHGHEAASDLVQGFLAELIEREELGALSAEGGRFRAWLVAALRHFVAHERERAAAWKRGGRARVLSLDADAAERRYAHEPADPRSPEAFYERKWALAVLERALAALEREQAEKGREKTRRSAREATGILWWRARRVRRSRDGQRARAPDRGRARAGSGVLHHDPIRIDDVRVGIPWQPKILGDAAR